MAHMAHFPYNNHASNCAAHMLAPKSTSRPRGPPSLLPKSLPIFFFILIHCALIKAAAIGPMSSQWRHVPRNHATLPSLTSMPSTLSLPPYSPCTRYRENMNLSARPIFFLSFASAAEVATHRTNSPPLLRLSPNPNDHNSASTFRSNHHRWDLD